MNPGVTGLNYQRMKDGFLPDISYDELEDAYDRKTSFQCAGRAGSSPDRDGKGMPAG